MLDGVFNSKNWVNFDCNVLGDLGHGWEIDLGPSFYSDVGL